jgi:hypothetical protein
VEGHAHAKVVGKLVQLDLLGQQRVFCDALDASLQPIDLEPVLRGRGRKLI